MKKWGLSISILFILAFADLSCQKEKENKASGTYCGTNCYYLMVYAAEDSLKSQVLEVLDDAKAMGLQVIRTWAFNDGEGWNALQTSPGVYQEKVLRGLDFVIAEAGKRGLKLILPLVNNWDDYGGIKQYCTWAGGKPHNEFFSDPTMKGWYKDFVQMLLNRQNTISGKVYKEDETIFAWELGNELRAPGAKVSLLVSWMEEMASFIKSIDHQHLLASGLEGFSLSDPVQWMTIWGTDFIQCHQVNGIDLCTCHLYPDMWNLSPGEVLEWLDKRIAWAEELQKPLIVEEFGLKRGAGGDTTARDEFFSHVIERCFQNKLLGFNFWILYDNNYPDYDGFGVYYPDDKSTIEVLSENCLEDKRILAGGYWNSRLTEEEGGELQMIALARGADWDRLEVAFNGMPTGIYLFDDGNQGDFVAGDGVYGLKASVACGFPCQRLLIELLFSPFEPLTSFWPFLSIK